MNWNTLEELKTAFAKYTTSTYEDADITIANNNANFILVNHPSYSFPEVPNDKLKLAEAIFSLSILQNPSMINAENRNVSSVSVGQF